MEHKEKSDNIFLKILIYFIIIIIIGLIIGGVIYLFSGDSKEISQKETTEKIDKSKDSDRPHCFKMNQFRVRLDNRGDNNYLYYIDMRISICYPRGNVEIKSALTDFEVQIASSIRLMLSQKKYNEINSQEQREALKTELFAIIQNILKKNNVNVSNWVEDRLSDKRHKWIEYVTFDILKEKRLDLSS